MRRIATAAALMALAMAAPVEAGARQGVNATAPATVNSPQRRAILNAIRPAVEAKLGPRIEFVVQVIRVQKGWAFVAADPRRRGGQPIDAKAYLPGWEKDDPLTVTAVLRFRQGRWSVVRQVSGATDAWYCDIGPRSLKRGYGC